MKQRILPLILLAFFLKHPSIAMAQDGQQSLEGYVPPPLFSETRPVPPKKEQPKPPSMPKLSVPIETKVKPSEPPTPKKGKIIPPPTKARTVEKEPVIIPDEKPLPVKSAPKIQPPVKKEPEIKPVINKATEAQKEVIVPLKKPDHPKDVFQGTPIEDIAEEKIQEKIEKTPVNPGIEPIDLLKEEKKKNINSDGVVKGPKTMPANKKQSVDTEVLFEDKTDKIPDLIDRAQQNTPLKNTKKHTKTEEKVSKGAVFELPRLHVLADGQKKLNLVFVDGQKKLQEKDYYALQQLITPFLKDNKNHRVQLISFASPQEDSLNGDRRLALSRVMEIRDYIENQGISANRVDIRSLGSQTDIIPMDRVEIFLID